MRKRFWATLLCMMLCFSAAQADTSGFSRRLKYGTLLDYTNYVYGYAIGVYGKFSMYPEETLQTILADIDEDRKTDPEADFVYDVRYWVSPDYRYQFHIQVKEPTHASFEAEISNAPNYAAAIADQFDPENELTQVHDSILRMTPEGRMLETAVTYFDILDDGSKLPVAFVYYDCYLEGLEYIFGIHDFGGDYQSAQALLDEMVQTVQIIPMSRKK